MILAIVVILALVLLTAVDTAGDSRYWVFGGRIEFFSDVGRKPPPAKSARQAGHDLRSGL